jgi:hypothetical protein
MPVFWSVAEKHARQERLFVRCRIGRSSKMEKESNVCVPNSALTPLSMITHFEGWERP